MRLDDTKDNQSVKSAGIVLHAEVTAHALLSLLGNNKGCKTNTHTHRHLKTTLYELRVKEGNFLLLSALHAFYSYVVQLHLRNFILGYRYVSAINTIKQCHNS